MVLCLRIERKYLIEQVAQKGLIRFWRIVGDPNSRACTYLNIHWRIIQHLAVPCCGGQSILLGLELDCCACCAGIVVRQKRQAENLTTLRKLSATSGAVASRQTHISEELADSSLSRF